MSVVINIFYIYLFIIVLVAVSIDLVGLFISKYSRFRTWPPTKGSKIWYLELGLTWTWTSGFFLICLLSINSFIFNSYHFLLVGEILFIIGLYFDVQGIRHLDSGYVKEGELITTGIYSVTRNPQYVGSLLMGLGAVLFLNSFYGLLLSIPAAAWFIMAPFVEEPLLRSKYCVKYIAYCYRVPRFLWK